MRKSDSVFVVWDSRSVDHEKKSDSVFVVWESRSVEHEKKVTQSLWCGSRGVS